MHVNYRAVSVPGIQIVLTRTEAQELAAGLCRIRNIGSTAYTDAMRNLLESLEISIAEMP